MKEKPYEVRAFNQKEISGVATFNTIGLQQSSSSLVNYAKLKHIADMVNSDWEKDWSNATEYIYYPYFKNIGSGWSLGSIDCRCSCSFGAVAFKSKELAEHIGTYFIDLYEKLLN